MTSWEPYPQAKWTREQERAYADRQSTRAAPSRSSTSTAGRKKRVVRTAAGARRYKVPIGSEIGTARNAESARWQKDKDSSNRYRSLVGTDQNAQRAALGKLVNGQLQRLARTAYSFKSSDPNVVRLRIGVANEMRRRGMNVNDYGGLGPKTKNPGPAGTWARDHAKRVAARKKKAAATRKAQPKKTAAAKKPTTTARSAMSARKNDRRLIEMSAPQLRTAIRVFPRVPADKRRAVARVLVRRALELGAPHFLGESVIEAANLPDQTRTRVIELAGKWKHGWIPLDGAALASKMKGGKGKPWWDGGTGKGTNKARVRNGRLTVAGGVGVPKKNPGGGRPKMHSSSFVTHKGGPLAPGGGRVHTRENMGGKATAEDLRRSGFGPKESRRAASFQSNETTGGKYAAQPRKPKPKKVTLKPEFTAKQRRDIAYSQHQLMGRDYGKQGTVRASDTTGSFNARKRADVERERKQLAAKPKVSGDRNAPWPRNLSRQSLREQHKTERDGLNEHSTKADRQRVARLEKELQARGLKPMTKGALSSDQKRYAMKNPDYSKYKTGSAYENAKREGKVAKPSGSATDRFRAGVGSNRTSVVKSGSTKKEAPKMNTTAPKGNTKVTAAEQTMIDQMADMTAKNNDRKQLDTEIARLRADGGDLNNAIADALAARKPGKSGTGASPRQMDDGELANAKAAAKRSGNRSRVAEIEAEQERRRKSAASGKGWQSSGKA